MVDINKYNNVKNSLKGKTTQEKIKDIEERIFYLNMIDMWQPEDWELSEIFRQIRNELLERENRENGKK